jgi:hypothetical protein
LVLLGIVILADTLFWTRGMGQSARARFIDAKSRFNKEQPSNNPGLGFIALEQQFIIKIILLTNTDHGKMLKILSRKKSIKKYQYYAHLELRILRLILFVSTRA